MIVAAAATDGPAGDIEEWEMITITIIFERHNPSNLRYILCPFSFAVPRCIATSFNNTLY